MSKRDKSKKLKSIEMIVLVFVCLFVLAIFGLVSKFNEPVYRIDSLLVNESGVHKIETMKQHRHLKSTDLKQTSIVATLDCPMPIHNNVIWCGTFQIAWDRLKNNIIGEPIRLIGAEDLDNRLNNNKFSPENLEADSFYATAGFVKDGIIEQIQSDMAKLFPTEPLPVFDMRYEILPEVSVAYAFLSVNVGFIYPFYVNNDTFTFHCSNGANTNVKSFCADPEVWDPNVQYVHEQVEILYSKYSSGDQINPVEFAVDLCKETNPYQIVLACIPKRKTLSETLATVESKISKFKEKMKNRSVHIRRDFFPPNKLNPMDKLIIPDIVYKLTHQFTQLKKKLQIHNFAKKVISFLMLNRQ